MKAYAAQLWLLAAIGVAALFSWFSDRLDPYFLRVIMTIGINITLAVSLNLVNGYTGQFSLGHAGFMCVGAYTSATITMFVVPKLVCNAPPNTAIGSAVFFVAFMNAGIAAALSGLLVGAPSLRL